MSLTLYYNPFSQPSRAVANFLNANKIQYVTKEINILQGEHRQPEYQGINPLGQCPAIDDNGFRLGESCAILQYLAQSRHVEDHWYPKDPKKCSKIDEYLAWHHGNLRKNSSGLVFNKVIAPMANLPIFGNPADFEKALIPTLQQMENYFLTGGWAGWIASDNMSIADLVAFHELIGLRMVDFDFSPFRKLSKYIEKMLTIPEVRETCQPLFEMLKKQGINPESPQALSKNANILYIIAHPNVDRSFNHRLTLSAKKELEAGGHNVKVVDLFKINWDARSGKHDFTHHLKPDGHFDYQAEQKAAAENHTFVGEVQEQIDNMKWADAVIWQFPIYWYRHPALIQSYAERVFGYYVAYGGDHSFNKEGKKKKWMFSCTTGAPRNMYSPEGFFQKDLDDLFYGFYTCASNLLGFERIPNYYACGVNFASDDQKNQMVADYAAHLKKYY